MLKFLQQSGNKSKVKQNYTQKIVSAEEGKMNDKYLQILIFKCEADWAYAMSMKKAISSQEGGSGQQEEAKAGLKNLSLFNQQEKHANRNTFRLKVHSRKRF